MKKYEQFSMVLAVISSIASGIVAFNNTGISVLHWTLVVLVVVLFNWMLSRQALGDKG